MIVIAFTSSEATLESAGGKAANLARLTRAGFNVPKGFIISTEAYRIFVTANLLSDVISESLARLTAQDANQLEKASERIRSAFTSGKMPSELAQQIQDAYAQLTPQKKQPVAVRSSATAEDLPELSFAGQQDTYLNVIGEKQLMEAIINCWGSLWSARAIGYRQRNNIPQDRLALAVVVQEMVASDAAGVLFTANPLTGLYSESVIDAAFGLGEALVSGQVEPDHFVVDTTSMKCVSKTLGAKQRSTRGRPDGGVETVEENASAQQTLSEDQIQQLTATGLSIQKEYNAPQDIEWAFAGGTLHILQSRAITTLFPIPLVSVDPLIIWFSFGAVQGMVGPMTPLGRDAIQCLVVGAGKMMGTTLNYGENNQLAEAGERLWIKVSDLIRNPIGSRIIFGALGFIEPSIEQILRLLAADPRLGKARGKLKMSTLRQLAHFALPVLVRLAGNVLQPEKARARFDAAIDCYLSTAQILPEEDRFGRLTMVISFTKDRIANAFSFLLPKFIPIMGPSMAALNILIHYSPELAMEVTRGLPHNVTTEMDLALWQTAATIRTDKAAVDLFLELDAEELAYRYQSADLPALVQNAIQPFMEQYGMRGVAEIDFGQPRWREQPAAVMNTLQSYLQIDPQFSPDKLFARGEQAAINAIELLAANARSQHGGWIKEKIVRAAARRIRLLMGARESPKFFAIRTIGIARKALLEVGKEFVEAGTIDRADDLIFFNLSELSVLANSAGTSPLMDWKPMVAARRSVFEREQRRKQVPRVLVSDGRVFYEGLGAATDTGSVITGSPVSPGVVEGIVHVILDPRGSQLIPGEILVCPGTDPAWTPLFLSAGGLITEVGGMMTHGSVVAREYGIPAVVGVHQATSRFKNGQKIRVDGTTGKIIVLDA